jgi:alkanesulfonate monooxygenase SsuD/methylene tetrahydromethanopterin reductase-like flavin-dependent oxidoreductase (luciferase family)
VARAAHYGLPLVLAIIGGDPARFAPYARLYRDSLHRLGTPELPIAVHSPGHIAESDDEAREQMWPPYRAMRNTIGAERGWPPADRAEFDAEVEHGSLYVGSPETVAQKIAHTMSLLQLARFDLKYSAGTLSHEHMLRSIELYGTRVVPRVRELLGANALAA